MAAHTTKKYFLLCCAMLLTLTGFQLNVLKTSPPQRSSFSFCIMTGSKISVIGSTNVNEFTCFSGETSTMNSGSFLFNDVRNVITFHDAVFNITTQSLECGNQAMNHNLYKTLHSDEFPYIVIYLQHAQSKSGSPLTLSLWTPMTASIYVTLAGVRRINQIEFTAKQIAGSTYHIIGAQDLSLSDYNINPPSALFGLIKVKTTITVKFDLIVSANAGLLE